MQPVSDGAALSSPILTVLILIVLSLDVEAINSDPEDERADRLVTGPVCGL